MGERVAKNKDPLTREQVIIRCQEFERAAARLAKKEFTKRLFTDPGSFTFTSLQVSDDEWVGQSTAEDPESETLESFLYVLRQFEGEQDDFSIKKIAQAFASPEMPEHLRDNFAMLHTMLQTALNDTPDAVIIDVNTATGEQKAFTHKEILKTFLYGGSAHANEGLRGRFRRWQSHPMFGLYQVAFTGILVDFVHFIADIRDLNKQALEELT